MHASVVLHLRVVQHYPWLHLALTIQHVQNWCMNCMRWHDYILWVSCGMEGIVWACGCRARCCCLNCKPNRHKLHSHVRPMQLTWAEWLHLTWEELTSCMTHEWACCWCCLLLLQASGWGCGCLHCSQRWHAWWSACTCHSSSQSPALDMRQVWSLNLTWWEHACRAQTWLHDSAEEVQPLAVTATRVAASQKNEWSTCMRCHGTLWLGTSSSACRQNWQS